MGLRLSRMCRNVTRIVYNALKNVSATSALSVVLPTNFTVLQVLDGGDDLLFGRYIHVDVKVFLNARMSACSSGGGLFSISWKYSVQRISCSFSVVSRLPCTSLTSISSLCGICRLVICVVI